MILMSVRPNAPYRDRLEDGGTTLVYEGHDFPEGASCPNPKVVDQPEHCPSGSATQKRQVSRCSSVRKAWRTSAGASSSV